MGALLIGDVAERAGVPTATIRYYESIRLLKPAARSSSGYRRYSERTVEELQFIRKAQALGFSLEEVGEILTLSRSGKTPCSQVLSLGHQHLAAVDERIRQLHAFRDQLASELAKWDQQQTAATCTVSVNSSMIQRPTWQRSSCTAPCRAECDRRGCRDPAGVGEYRWRCRWVPDAALLHSAGCHVCSGGG
jgi:DNA-binding transcriptional MerR regulator